MIKDGRAYTLGSENGLGDASDMITDGAIMGGTDTAGFMALVFQWIHERIAPASRTYTKHSSYGFKHIVENDIGHYVANNQFKDAMLLCGYQPVKPNETNWLFKIKFSEWSDSCEKLAKVLTKQQNMELEQFVYKNCPDIDVTLMDDRNNYCHYGYKDSFGSAIRWYKTADGNDVVVKISGLYKRFKRENNDGKRD